MGMKAWTLKQMKSSMFMATDVYIDIISLSFFLFVPFPTQYKETTSENSTSFSPSS
jgi:hypothetical protein